MNHYEPVSLAIKYWIEHGDGKPSLDELAEVVGMSSHSFMQMFTEWAGVGLQEFTEYLTDETLKKEIQLSCSLIEANGRASLSARSGCLNPMVELKPFILEEYKLGGKGLTMEYGFADTAFGCCFVAATSHGICRFDFVDNRADEILSSFSSEWHATHRVHNDEMAASVVRKYFSGCDEPLLLHLKGSPFQMKVWKALLTIPAGCVVSYSELSAMIGQRKAVRAVASAVAANPVGLIIPCHRVIRKEGAVGGYRWRSERKACIIGWERARRTVISS